MSDSRKIMEAQEESAKESIDRMAEQGQTAGNLSIPQSVKLAGLTIKTIIDPELYKERKVLGEARYPQQQIILEGSGLMHNDMWAQNYFHELVHWILFVMSEDDLRNNEKFVETFSMFLHQALSSAEGVAERKL